MREHVRDLTALLDKNQDILVHCKVLQKSSKCRVRSLYITDELYPSRFPLQHGREYKNLRRQCLCTLIITGYLRLGKSCPGAFNW